MYDFTVAEGLSNLFTGFRFRLVSLLKEPLANPAQVEVSSGLGAFRISSDPEISRSLPGELRTLTSPEEHPYGAGSQERSPTD